MTFPPGPHDLISASPHWRARAPQRPSAVHCAEPSLAVHPHCAEPSYRLNGHLVLLHDEAWQVAQCSPVRPAVQSATSHCDPLHPVSHEHLHSPEAWCAAVPCPLQNASSLQVPHRDLTLEFSDQNSVTKE